MSGDVNTERLAAWMIEHSFATGHGNDLESLLKELSWQVREQREKWRVARERLRVAEDL